MSGQERMLDQGQILSLHGPVPRRPVLLLSVFAHVLAWISIVMFRHTTKVYVVPVELQTAQVISGSASLSFNPPKAQPARPNASLSYKHRNKRQARLPETETVGDGTATQVLREHAKQTTAAIMGSIKFRLTYGFSPTTGDKLPVQTAGKIPYIAAADLPPRFEQYVTVEVTINVDGRVADARVVGGEVSPTIEQTLLSAIREFKYDPATRNGAPVAFQLDIVIHIPS